ncbi:mechanosensitive ion channel domain-containing protein [uncultured Bacteroides sp.]|uniref:mechanosensitive ion channel family protein n=1 Tax=uncultured Bacteroides sp. TaxID=162156 RepID=UPI002AA8C2A6|nr:mechanosensitive ion channel domain-containing protein [uncultured Bacteroides sp.]
MNMIENLLQQEVYRILFGTILFVISIVATFIIYKRVISILKRKARFTKSKVDDFIIDILKIPVLWLMLWILFKIFSHSFLSQTDFFATLMKINNILLILTIGWLMMKVVKAFFYYYLNKLDMTAADNLEARRNFTKMKIFENIIVVLISVVVVAFCLMTFEQVRSIGISLLTSAGIAGIIVGFAAQKSIATILAGIQIAITQPIRLDDVVIVEGEWGRIEEITLTYVVVKIWDERRLVLPVTYFIEKPFQNWTRNTAEILGTIFLYVDYSLPVDALRKQLLVLLENQPLWDKRVANIQVTDTKERYKELRVLVSSRDASKNWDLRVDLREKLIDFINKEYPDCFVKVRFAGSEVLSKKEEMPKQAPESNLQKS